MSELLNKVQEIAEGKDLSSLGSSIKFVVDEEVVFIDPEAGTITSDDNEASCTVTVDKFNSKLIPQIIIRDIMKIN